MADDLLRRTHGGMKIAAWAGTTGSASGSLRSYSASYSTARAGGTLNWVLNPEVGQYLYSGATYYCYEMLLYFRLTGIPADVTIEWASVSVSPRAFGLVSDSIGWLGDHTTLNLRDAASLLPEPISPSDWVPGADVDAMALCGTLESRNLKVGQYTDFDCTADIIDALDLVNDRALFMITTQTFEDGDAPTTDERCMMQGVPWSFTTEEIMLPLLTLGYSGDFTEDAPDTGGRSLMARPFTTRAAAAEEIARQHETAIVDWWIEDDVVRAETRPTDPANIPRQRWYVVNRQTPGTTVDVIMDSEDTPDFVRVLYKAFGVTDVKDGTVLHVYSPSAGPTSATDRVRLVDTTSNFMGTSEAQAYADLTMARISADVMAATVTARGGLHTVDGLFVPAPLIKAGDWIDITDQLGHVPTYITGTTYNRTENVVTITTGGREQSELIVPGVTALFDHSSLTVTNVEEPGDSYASGDTGTPADGSGDDDTVPSPVAPKPVPLTEMKQVMTKKFPLKSG